MEDFTQCRKRMLGDLISWNINDWGTTSDIADEEVEEETIDFKLMCNSKMVFRYIYSFISKLLKHILIKINVGEEIDNILGETVP